MNAHLTPRELDVIAAVWRLGGATVSEVRDELDDDLAYTTVLTVLRGLEQKGCVTHTVEGRAHRFHAAIEPSEAGKGILDRVVEKVYQGSPVRLVAQLVSERELTAGEIEEITALLERLPGAARGSD